MRGVVKPIPDGYHGALPYLICKGAAQAIEFYGDRSVGFEDPFGHMWGFATHIEDVPLDEMKRRSAEKFGAC